MELQSIHDETGHVEQLSNHLFRLELLDQLNILLLRILLGRALSLVPGLPLVFPLEIKHAWLGFVVVAHSGLLKESVELAMSASSIAGKTRSLSATHHLTNTVRSPTG